MRRFSLCLYNLLFIPILLILLPGYLLRIRKRGGYGNKALQRLGIFNDETAFRIGTGRIWIHAVSVGEVGIALKFANAFYQRNPGSRFLVSTTTSTGLAILEKSASAWLEPIANPIDFPFLTSALVKRFHPAALLMVEADIWPNRLAACKDLGIPVALLNARLSTRSERRFRIGRTLTSPFFNQLDLITLTGEEDNVRWLSLGLRHEVLHWTGNMKHDAESSGPVDQISVPEDLGWQSGDPLFLGASTHQGEELEIANSFLLLRNEFPNLRLVIAPRHVERRWEIHEKLTGIGLSSSLRSQAGKTPADILLLDTTGELSAWYRLATCVFVGKSLPSSVNKGGQNMIEPLQAERPVLIGPHTGNFEPLATRLCDAGAALRVMDSEEITTAVRSLFLDSSIRNRMIAAARNVLEPHQGATKRNCVLVEGIIGKR